MLFAGALTSVIFVFFPFLHMSSHVFGQLQCSQFFCDRQWENKRLLNSVLKTTKGCAKKKDSIFGPSHYYRL